MSTIENRSIQALRRFRFAVMRDWRVFLLATLGVVLSLACGYTTWKGMSNFTGESTLSLMVTIGMQGIMLVTAWLIGETFANNPARSGNALVGYGKGLLTIFAHLPLWAMWLGTMSASAFFSFDNLFSSSLYGHVQRTETGRVYVRSEIESMITRIEARLLERRTERHVAFVRDPEWAEVKRRFGDVSEGTRTASTSIEQHHRKMRDRRLAETIDAERELANARKQLVKVAEEVEALETQIARGEPLRVPVRNRVQQLEAEHGRLAAEADEAESKANHEKDATRGTGKVGEGPVYRQHMADATRLRKEAANVKRDLERSRGELKLLDSQMIAAGESLKLREGERKTLETSIATVGSKAQAAKTALEALASERSGAFSVAGHIERLQNGVSNLERSPESLKRGDGGRTELEEVSTLCEQLLQALAGTDDETLKQRARSLSCTLGTAARFAADVTRHNDNLREFERRCKSLPARLATADVETLVNEGRNCVEASGLAAEDTQGMMLELNRLKLEHSGNAHPFVIDKNALFLYREPLAYLALGIALTIEMLVFISGLLGARLVSRRMNSLGDPSAAAGIRSATAVNTAIGPGDPDEIRNAKSFLACLQSHPSDIDGYRYMGYVEPELIADPAERARVMNIVTAGSSVVGGAQVVRPNRDGERLRYYVMRQFYEELAATVVSWNKASPPPNVGGSRPIRDQSVALSGTVGGVGSTRTLGDWLAAQSGSK